MPGLFRHRVDTLNPLCGSIIHRHTFVFLGPGIKPTDVFLHQQVKWPSLSILSGRRGYIHCLRVTVWAFNCLLYAERISVVQQMKIDLMFYWSYSWHALLAVFLQELSTQQIFLTGRPPNPTGWQCMRLIMVLSLSTLPSKSTLKWRMWMTMPLSHLSPSITQSSWRTLQRMYLSSRSKPRTPTPALMTNWLTGLQVEIPRTSL